MQHTKMSYFGVLSSELWQGQSTIPKAGENNELREYHLKSTYLEQKPLEPQTSRST